MISFAYGVQFDWAPFFCNTYFDKFVFITNNNKKLQYFSSIFSKINNLDYVILPEFENESDEKLPYNRQIACERASALYKIINKKANIVFTTAKAINYKTAPASHFTNIFTLKIGQKFVINDLQKKLIEFSYDFIPITEKLGQFSVRGGIIDVFSTAENIPIRIEFCENYIENIKTFDPITQRSISTINEITISKCLELPNIKDNCYKFSDPHIKELVENGILFSGIEWQMEKFYDKTISILDYLPHKYIFDFELEKNNFSDNINIYCNNINTIVQKHNVTEICPIIADNYYAKENDFSINIRDKNFLTLFNKKISKFKKIVISVISEGAIEILNDVLTQQYTIIDNFAQIQDGINIIISDLSSGFIKENTIFFTAKELKLNTKKISTVSKFKSYKIFEPGAYVVHKEHGVGIFEGIINLEVNGILYDFLSIIYKNNDKLLVPVDHIKLLSYYGSSENDIQIDKLGGTGWSARYNKLKKKLLIIADELIQMAAKRKNHKIIPIKINQNDYEKFCKKFKYEETCDQLAAIHDIEQDLLNNYPMDRLICGDVGFGKTEVAMRAAFLVASSGKQVAVLVPTTILANQHYKNFKERFSNIKILQISRFVTKTQLKQNLEYINNGETCIIIGTHAILKEKIPNLGLIIIDEEQHFGVKQKELLKKEDIHILSMSATPIPRTLQMSLSGIRDLSVIATPPIDRLVVKTFVLNEDDPLIDEAINKEIQRGGQIFVVAPRTSFLQQIAQNFKNRFPNLKIKTTHGKSTDIENVINDFCDYKIDILVSTNIIDSGIDIKNANTIIIYNADMFGTSQLYQLRGRVGRLHGIQGYAYMLLPKKCISQEAENRLNAIQEACMFGGGFKLAEIDLELRGAGNIIGNEQSGHIKDVGIEMYQSMLEKAINMQNFEEITPKVNLGIPVFIPHRYIPDDAVRIMLYRKIGDINNVEDLDSIKIEIVDRFGKIPQEFNNLFIIMRIKLLCVAANIEQIDVGPKGYIISFVQNNINITNIMQFLSQNPNTAKIRQDNKLVICKTWKSIIDRTTDIEATVKQLAN